MIATGTPHASLLIVTEKQHLISRCVSFFAPAPPVPLARDSVVAALAAAAGGGTDTDTEGAALALVFTSPVATIAAPPLASPWLGVAFPLSTALGAEVPLAVCTSDWGSCRSGIDMLRPALAPAPAPAPMAGPEAAVLGAASRVGVAYGSLGGRRVREVGIRRVQEM